MLDASVMSHFLPSPSRPVPIAQVADGLAAKTSAKAGKTSSYSEHYPCPAILLQFWMRMAIPLSATATMRGARRCGALVNWRRRWARCSRLGIAGMCLTRRRDCTIFVIGITILKQACFLQQTILAFLQKLTIAFTKRIYTHIVIITPFLVMIRGRYLGVACWCNCRCCIRCNWSNCQRCCYERFKSRG